MSIGGFALVSGLSITTLRHYADVGLLEPARVDPDTGYRLYRRDQLPAARTVRLLRSLELPVETVRELVRRDDDAFTRETLIRHRGELAARSAELERTLCLIDQLTEGSLAMPATEECRIVQVSIDTADPAGTVRFYEEAFGVAFDESISSFAFGAYPGDSFFLLTIEERDEPRRARFGLLVDDVDTTHARALAAGATEVAAPAEYAWKPRCSRIADPGGNEVDLYQS